MLQNSRSDTQRESTNMVVTWPRSFGCISKATVVMKLPGIQGCGGKDFFVMLCFGDYSDVKFVCFTKELYLVF